jgi:lysophospholipase L1-like esterase
LALIAAGVATVVAVLLAELVLRLFVPAPQPLGRLGYADAAGNPIAGYVEGLTKGHIVAVPGEPPRVRYMFAPGLDFFLTYTDNDVLRRDWLDEQGRVANHINQWGLRERDTVTPDKPDGERRIVCIGDSFTFGWGIPAEQNWVRLLEHALRQDGADVRTVNCGAAGTVCIDEYVAGLEQRFDRFQPDAVLLTICLNDLVPSSGVSLIDPAPATGIRLVDAVAALLHGDPLALDPSRDWVGELLALPQDQAEAGGLCNHGRPFEAMWSQGVPQASLRRAKAFCDARGIPFLVVLWPFLQGLGPGRFYPFQKLHDLVAADCAAAGIPLLDVLPQLASTPQEDLWVTPADPHPNPTAQRLVSPAIVAFVRGHAKR